MHPHSFVNKHHIAEPVENSFKPFPTQDMVLFLKRKYGLYKTLDVLEKRAKQKIVKLSNLIKQTGVQKKKYHLRKKPKIIFYKKLNKFYFRSGRTLLLKYLNYKKYLIQKFITKKISNLIKQPVTLFMFNSNLINLLVKCNVFYTFSEVESYVNGVGLLLNGKWVYNSKVTLKPNDIFALPNSNTFFKFYRKNKLNIITTIRKLKFYKYRSKFYVSKKKFIWLSTSSWLKQYAFLYTNKRSNVEFDPKILVGCYLYDFDFTNCSGLYEYANLSLYMARSYNWKYLT